MGEIKEGGYLEGGDFFPCGPHLAMVGIGLRSNMEACQQLMDKDLLGTQRFAVVRDDFDRNQVRLRLAWLTGIIWGGGARDVLNRNQVWRGCTERVGIS